jgi:hypothetical protein
MSGAPPRNIAKVTAPKLRRQRASGNKDKRDRKLTRPIGKPAESA